MPHHSLPSELLDRIYDHLIIQRDALGDCCRTTKLELYVARADIAMQDTYVLLLTHDTFDGVEYITYTGL